MGEDEKDFSQPDIENVMNLINLSKIEIKVDLSEPFVVTLKKKFSKIYGNVIDPQYFEFTSYKNHYFDTLRRKSFDIINHKYLTNSNEMLLMVMIMIITLKLLNYHFLWVHIIHVMVNQHFVI